MKKVYVVQGNSESGDHYLAVFAKKPTKAQLKKLCIEWDSTPELDGPGEFGTYIRCNVSEEEVL